MNKKTFNILLISFVAAAVIGIILIASNATPYMNCKSWLSDFSYPDGYLYALKHIDRYRTGYFSGIFLLVGSVVGYILTVVFKTLKKNEPQRDDSISNDFD